ncbi:glycosyltransferase [Ureibacillus aquaedulcis]|uniref:Glycosyltransferase n=1 Tax=Ureibacillus aquaedulcis TaxID=3058421 RepID=A0ABT8GUP8_9BACL|nr:glycosyltransferase [Ureibacillus sp. BA0131]MDN4495140.1 glycosyltransferase [Ureibacillus sp. BA0131]
METNKVDINNRNEYRITIAMVLPSLKIGGGQKIAIDIANSLDSRRFNVIFIIIEEEANTSFEKNICEKFDVAFLRKEKGFSIKTIFRLMKVLRRQKVDVVHVHLRALIYTSLATLFTKVNTRIYTVHSIAQHDGGGYLRFLYKVAFKYWGYIPVAICDYVKDTMIDYYRLSSDKVPLIYNGIDLKRYPEKQRIESSSNRINFISVASFWGVKNHELLLKAFASASKQCPDIYLTLLGDGPLQQGMIQLTKNLGIHDRVSFRGNVTNVSEHLRMSDVFIMSSDFEGFPLSVIEAMATGLPIITTAAGGVIDLVKHEYNGLIVPTRDIESLSNAMIEITINENTRKNFAANSKLLSEQYNILDMVEAYTKLY